MLLSFMTLWTLCDPMDCGPPGFSVHGILQARTLEGVPILFSRGSSRPRDWTRVSCTAGRFFTVWATRKSSLFDYKIKSLCLTPHLRFQLDCKPHEDRTQPCLFTCHSYVHLCTWVTRMFTGQMLSRHSNIGWIRKQKTWKCRHWRWEDLRIEKTY